MVGMKTCGEIKMLFGEENWRCRPGKQVGRELWELMETQGAESVIDINNRGEMQAVREEA